MTRSLQLSLPSSTSMASAAEVKAFVFDAMPTSVFSVMGACVVRLRAP